MLSDVIQCFAFLRIGSNLTKTVRIEIVQVKWAVLYSYFADRVDAFSSLDDEELAVNSRACVDVDSQRSTASNKKDKWRVTLGSLPVR